MKISCEEASDICNKSQYKEASIWQIVKLQFHFVYCKVCKKYSRKNSQLTSLCKKADLHTMPSNEKEALKRSLEEKFQ
ncbi:MAG: hypothetical protein ED555_07015 [Allomuricauda sp.]|nr:MAG: hypothetical protein ED555_07015 [Allomuricauda sp.]